MLAYRLSWKRFARWSDSRGLDPLVATPEMVALYLADRHSGAFPEGARPLNPTSLDREYSGVSFFLRPRAPSVWLRRRPPAVIAELLSGAHRTTGRPPVRKRPLLGKHLIELARMAPESLGPGLSGLRDRALLLVGFMGAFRRSELAALEYRDLELQPRPGGLRVTLRRSKTDQEGQGRVVGILRADDPGLCPIKALCVWMRDAHIHAGPVFRRVRADGTVSESAVDGEDVSDAVKRACKLLGLPPSKYAGHSLRSGFVTEASMQGVGLDVIADQTGHVTLDQVRRYIRREDPFRVNASRGMLDRADAGARRRRQTPA